MEGPTKARPGSACLTRTSPPDLRQPQEYFHRIWSTALRANDRAAANPTSDDHDHNVDDVQACA
jgi:hypothetical protein